MSSNDSKQNNPKQKPVDNTTKSRSNSGIKPDNKPKYRECFESYNESKNK